MDDLFPETLQVTPVAPQASPTSNSSPSMQEAYQALCEKVAQMQGKHEAHRRECELRQLATYYQTMSENQWTGLWNNIRKFRGMSAGNDLEHRFWAHAREQRIV